MSSNQGQSRPRRGPPNSRIFIGNLKVEAVTPESLEQMFSKYGNIIERPVLLKSFGFVQFDSEESARAALAGENGRDIAGLNIDLHIADNRASKAREAARNNSNNNGGGNRGGNYGRGGGPDVRNDRYGGGNNNNYSSGGNGNNNYRDDDRRGRKRRSPSPNRNDDYYQRDSKKQQHNNYNDYGQGGYNNQPLNNGPTVCHFISITSEIQNTCTLKMIPNFVNAVGPHFITEHSIVTRQRDLNDFIDSCFARNIRYVVVVHNLRFIVNLHINTGLVRKEMRDISSNNAIDEVKFQEATYLQSMMNPKLPPNMMSSLLPNNQNPNPLINPNVSQNKPMVPQVGNPQQGGNNNLLASLLQNPVPSSNPNPLSGALNSGGNLDYNMLTSLISNLQQNPQISSLLSQVSGQGTMLPSSLMNPTNTMNPLNPNQQPIPNMGAQGLPIGSQGSNLLSQNPNLSGLLSSMSSNNGPNSVLSSVLQNLPQQSTLPQQNQGYPSMGGNQNNYPPNNNSNYYRQ